LLSVFAIISLSTINDASCLISIYLEISCSYRFLIYILGVHISSLKGRLPISRRSLSPVISIFAPASRQHSRMKLSFGSRQTDSFFLGAITTALDTKAEIPAIKALNCSLLILFFVNSSRGV
jgi:hypothetical protein